ncbi:hypothetical protein ACUSIJ_20405 [Pseudochelatococcus sp. B33]
MRQLSIVIEWYGIQAFSSRLSSGGRSGQRSGVPSGDMRDLERVENVLASPTMRTSDPVMRRIRVIVNGMGDQ